MPEELNAIIQTAWPILLMIVIFYFLLYRPQKKQQKAREELLGGLKRGQKVVTIGGIYGVITDIDQDIIYVEVADKVTLKMTRSSVNSVVKKNG